MKKYYVEILWRSTGGNPCHKTATIEAETPSDALRLLSERVRKYRRCWKIDSGSAVEIN
jgi:hypothetical protein